MEQNQRIMRLRHGELSILIGENNEKHNHEFNINVHSTRHSMQ